MINKYKNYIRNTKKLMHKIGRKWIVVSAVLLGLIGGSALITHANADVLPQNEYHNATVSLSRDTQQPTNQTVRLGSINSSSRLSQYINTNNLVNMANEAKADNAQSSYSDLLGMANSTNVKHFLSGADIGTAQSDGSTWLGALNKATNDLNAITDNGSGSNGQFNDVDQKIKSANNEASNLSGIFEGWMGKSSSTPEAAGSVAGYAAVADLPPLAHTTTALSIIMNNQSITSKYDDVINNAINLTGNSRIQANALNNIHNDLNALGSYLSANGSGYIGNELTGDATTAANLADSLQPQPAPQPHSQQTPASTPSTSVNNNVSPTPDVSPLNITPVAPVTPVMPSNNGTNDSNVDTTNSSSSSDVSTEASNETNESRHESHPSVISTKPRKTAYYSYVRINHSLMLHTNAHFTKSNAVKPLYPGMIFKIEEVVKKHGLKRYMIQYKHQNYFITANARYISNAYLQRSDFKHNRRMRIRINKAVNEYRSLHFNKHTFIRHIRPNQKLSIRKVFTIGKGDVTRLQLTNHHYVTANKNFISVIK